MELIENNQPYLCLNMIVKNEGHIIKNTLIKLLNKITFDYWVISDTGSTDKTKEIILDFFKEEILKVNYLMMNGKILVIIEQKH